MGKQSDLTAPVRWWQGVTPLVAAIIGVLGVVIGGAINATITQATISAQIGAATSATQRSDRATVYFDFLDAADAYQGTVLQLQEEMRSKASSGQTFTLDDSHGVLSAFNKARPTFQGALNKVYVYGSFRAWELASGMAGALPTAGTQTFNLDYNEKRFTSDYKQLLDVLCHEVNGPVPRQCQLPHESAGTP
ncbi:hypothetical protein [Frigoribacterium sp. UYMn621]|uniref:hypothetical protein n=1 Tax=Frigoribacterium sp. UYMn621 TaxID=3156343 RepID=UPI00339A43C0